MNVGKSPAGKTLTVFTAAATLPASPLVSFAAKQPPGKKEAEEAERKLGRASVGSESSDTEQNLSDTDSRSHARPQPHAPPISPTEAVIARKKASLSKVSNANQRLPSKSGPTLSSSVPHSTFSYRSSESEESSESGSDDWEPGSNHKNVAKSKKRKKHRKKGRSKDAKKIGRDVHRGKSNTISDLGNQKETSSREVAEDRKRAERENRKALGKERLAIPHGKKAKQPPISKRRLVESESESSDGMKCEHAKKLKPKESPSQIDSLQPRPTVPADKQPAGGERDSVGHTSEEEDGERGANTPAEMVESDRRTMQLQLFGMDSSTDDSDTDSDSKATTDEHLESGPTSAAMSEQPFEGKGLSAKDVTVSSISQESAGHSAHLSSSSENEEDGTKGVGNSNAILRPIESKRFPQEDLSGVHCKEKAMKPQSSSTHVSDGKGAKPVGSRHTIPQAMAKPVPHPSHQSPGKASRHSLSSSSSDSEAESSPTMTQPVPLPLPSHHIRRQPPGLSSDSEEEEEEVLSHGALTTFARKGGAARPGTTERGSASKDFSHVSKHASGSKLGDRDSPKVPSGPNGLARDRPTSKAKPSGDSTRQGQGTRGEGNSVISNRAEKRPQGSRDGSPGRDDWRKRYQGKSEESSPSKKLRLSDIDFTGGRMNNPFSSKPPVKTLLARRGKPHPSHKVGSTPFLPHGPASHSSTKTHSVPPLLPKERLPGGEKAGKGERRVVSSSASNILRLSTAQSRNGPALLSSSSHSSESSQRLVSSDASVHNSKHRIGNSSGSLASSSGAKSHVMDSSMHHKDAILAAKFPQKRKLLSEVTASTEIPAKLTRGHSSSNSKGSSVRPSLSPHL